MVAARRSADAESEIAGALADGKRKAGPGVSRDAHALLALQRDAGNAAVGALMAAKQKQPDTTALGHIDAALKEVRGSEPEIDTVEKGLKAAQSAGVPVTLEGPKPPASALAVTTTGFGPNTVGPKKPTPPAKPVPPKSELGKAGARPAAKIGGAPAKPAAAPAVPAVAAADPAFMQVAEKVKAVAAAKKAHPPAAAKAKEAQDAAQAPADDLAGQAKASKVDSMDAQQAGSFDKQAFITAVKAAIEAKSPKTLQDATAPRGKADGVASEVKGMVSQGKEGQAKDIEAASDAPPDQSKAVPKPVTPMAQENPGTAPAVPAAGAAPKPAPPSQTDLSAGKQQIAQEQGDVTDEQMRQSNEQQFQQALEAKQTAAAHADTAPAEVRAQEQQVIGQAKADASAETAAGAAGMQGVKGAALAKLVADKGKTKTKDEAKRAEVTTKVQGIFAATEAEVKKILEGIDPKAEAEFTKGEAQARQAFESFVAAKVGAYKQDRYSGWLGGFRWVKDKVLSMPDKVNEFYTAGRELYLKQMDGVISRVADIVGNDLSLAKQKIAAGKAEIATFAKTLSPDLQKVGADASAEINQRFEQLESDVTDKQNTVVDTLATKYTEAKQGIEERIEALQAENKGFVDAAVDAVKGVVNTIRELAAMLRDVLSRAAGVVGDIVKKPVEFLGNLIAGVKGGILKFKDNVLDHLRKGLMSWLFGALAEAGVELPEKFDVRGIIKLLASIFGLTWSNIRTRLVRQIGEKAMAAAEKGVEIFQVLTSQGVAGLWQMLMEKLSDIKETILSQVKEFVITKIITAGITWLIGLLNPAAAFIKACKLIYDVVMFFVNNGSRIMKFVNTVIDSVADIVRGNVSGVVNKINDVLGQMVPIIIGFLASAIGLGGIGAKIRSIIETLQKPVNSALDWVIRKGLTLAGPIIKRLKGVSGKVKAKVAAGKAWMKGKVDAGKKWVKGKVDAGKARAKGDPKSVAIREAEKVLASRPTRADADSRVRTLSQQHNVPLRVVSEAKTPETERVHVQAMSTGSHNLPPGPGQGSPDAQLIDDGVTSLADREALLTRVRAVVRNDELINSILDLIKVSKLDRKRAVQLLTKLADQNLKGGYRLDTKERNDPDYNGRRFDMDYYGLFAEFGSVRIGQVKRHPYPIGFAYLVVKASGPGGATPITALGLDFAVDPSIELAKVKGVGSDMFKRAAAHFHTEYQAVLGEWYTLSFYASAAAGRPAMSANLVAYLSERKKGVPPAEAVKATWTYKRVKEIYGGVELEAQVTELADINNPPPDEKIVECLMKPKK